MFQRTLWQIQSSYKCDVPFLIFMSNCSVGQSFVFIYIHILVNVHGKDSALLTLMLSIFCLCNLVIKGKVFCFDHYGISKRMVSYKETLRSSLTVNQSKLYFTDQVIVRRQLLTNTYSTFQILCDFIGRNNVPSYIISVFGAEHWDLPHRTYVEPWPNRMENNILINLINF